MPMLLLELRKLLQSFMPRNTRLFALHSRSGSNRLLIRVSEQSIILTLRMRFIRPLLNLEVRFKWHALICVGRL